MKHSIFPNSVRSLLVASLSLAAQETAPEHRQFWTCAWCKDFTIGARGVDTKHGENGYELWMHVPELGNKEYRIAPTLFPGGQSSTHDASCVPDGGLVSPDARWVAFSQKYCTGYAVAFVLQRDENKGFIPLPKLVSEMGWDKFFEENPDQVAKRGEMAGITSLSDKSLCDLVAWEPDSSGVWFSLRGGDRRDAGIYHWYFLWETKTGKVIVPEQVKAINRFAASRWGGGDQLLTKDAAAAEEQHHVFLAELKSRLEEPILLVGKNTFEKEARARFDRFRNADRGGAPKGLKASDARGIIDGQRSVLFSTALKTGAVATLECP